ncbi:hypothetical protein [Ligilactobacillus equi]|uniref:hypothetical protein n=1 Tax=Ligilactobacillus equi TaxID=137357 RepID=UPI0007053176|nr:hypothetical protein [Ligilactobacillus equi]
MGELMKKDRYYAEQKRALRAVNKELGTDWKIPLIQPTDILEELKRYQTKALAEGIRRGTLLERRRLYRKTKNKEC